jgi:enoyl-CoA hydratase/carnithine racemase
MSSTEKPAYSMLKSELSDGIATLSVNRPEANNALNPALVCQLHQAFRQAAADPRVRGIVIGGEGKVFLGGADVPFFLRNMEAKNWDRIVTFSRISQALFNDIDRCPKPVVARVQGAAIGGGLELTLACDRVVAASRARLAFPEAGLGIYPGLGGTQRTPRKIGVGLTKWLLYTGTTLYAEDALAIGLIDAVVSPGELEATARHMVFEGRHPPGNPQRSAQSVALERFFAANRVEQLRAGTADTAGDPQLARAMRQLRTKGPLALRVIEALVDASEEAPLDEGLRLELLYTTEVFSSQDAWEGLSTLGKRVPVFHGC